MQTPPGGRWLLGLAIRRCGDQALCHGTGTAIIAQGARLADGLEALKDGRPRDVAPDVLALAQAARCWVARTETLDEDKAHAWARIGVSPAQGEAIALHYPVWRWAESEEGETFEPVCKTLAEQCADRSIRLDATAGDHRPQPRGHADCGEAGLSPPVEPLTVTTRQSGAKAEPLGPRAPPGDGPARSLEPVG